MADVETGRISANGVDFAYLAQGQGELALCLHGFPDSAETFRPLMAALAQAGYRAVAPFMRGYAPTEIPRDGRYQTAVLGQDAIALIDAFGAASAIVIGHDWGAAAAYAASIIAPSRVRLLVTASVPYGPGLVMSLITDPAQQRRSWYMYLFTSPLGEMALSFGNFGLIDRLWADWSPGFHPGETYMGALKKTFAAPGTALAAASYYKHTFLPDLQDPALAELQGKFGTTPITMPTLYLQGADDGCIGTDIVTEKALFTAGVETAIVPGAGHFLHLEKPETVNQRILDFLQAHPA
jgi:pimeloyl-ACP methyl ester carboxylesterase